jgi:hypothetical protein
VAQSAKASGPQHWGPWFDSHWGWSRKELPETIKKPAKASMSSTKKIINRSEVEVTPKFKLLKHGGKNANTEKKIKEQSKHIVFVSLMLGLSLRSVWNCFFLDGLSFNRHRCLDRFSMGSFTNFWGNSDLFASNALLPTINGFELYFLEWCPFYTKIRNLHLTNSLCNLKLQCPAW